MSQYEQIGNLVKSGTYTGRTSATGGNLMWTGIPSSTHIIYAKYGNQIVFPWISSNSPNEWSFHVSSNSTLEPYTDQEVTITYYYLDI